MTIIPFPGHRNRPVCGCGRSGQINRLFLPVSTRNLGQVKFAGSQGAVKPLLPIEALARLEVTLLHGIVPDEVELSGPGDPLAVPDRTLETAEMIHWKHPEIPLAVRTLGIGGEKVADALAKNGVGHVIMQVDAVDADVVRKLYAWIRPGKKTLPLSKAVTILLDEQAKGLRAFCRAGIKVTVKTTVYPGYNHDHIDEIAGRVAELGAEEMIIVPYKPEGDESGVPPEPDRETMDLIHAYAAKRIKIVAEQCGFEENISAEFIHGSDISHAGTLPKPTKERPRVAVVSSNGMDVDLHLGHAIRIMVYGPRKDGLVCLLESREAPEPGGGNARWNALAGILEDCFALIAASAGESPRMALARQGIPVLIAEGQIEGMVDALYGGGKRKKRK